MPIPSIEHRECGRIGRANAENRRGAALLFAISILAIFSALGMVYVDYMQLEVESANFELRQRRARQLAVAGVECAAAGLQQFVKYPDRRPVEMGSPYQIEVPTYRSIAMGESGIEAESMPAPRLAEFTFTLYDESGKVNINHAPASVLKDILEITGDEARNIAASVPRAGGSSGAAWYLSLDELASRGLAAGKDPAALSQFLTPYSVVDHANPQGHLNINIAEPAILAATLNLNTEQAAQVKGKGPFSSMDALARAVTEVRGVPGETVVPDPAIGFQSRCFRVVCEGRYARFVDEERYRQASAQEKRSYLMNVTVSRVEAVLVFAPDGSYEIVHWNVDVETAA